MPKKCLGSPKIKGCGKTKPNHLFSNAYANVCKKCESEDRFRRYHNIDAKDPKEQELIKLSTSTPWR